MNPPDLGSIDSSNLTHHPHDTGQLYRLSEPTRVEHQRQPNLPPSAAPPRRGSYDTVMEAQFSIHAHHYEGTDPMHAIENQRRRTRGNTPLPNQAQSPHDMSSPHSSTPPPTMISPLSYANTYVGSFEDKPSNYFAPQQYPMRSEQPIYYPYHGQYHPMPNQHAPYDARMLQASRAPPHLQSHQHRLSLYDSPDMTFSASSSTSQPTSASPTPVPFMGNRSNQHAFSHVKPEPGNAFESLPESELEPSRYEPPVRILPAKRVKVEKHDDDRAQQKHDTLLGPHTLEIDDPDGDDALSENESGAGEDGADERQESRPQRLVDISPYLNLPQKEAAKRLGLPVSTLSKRWKDATHDRKWPYRTIAKIDKEVMQILSNVPEGVQLSEDDSVSVRNLLRQRMECLAPVHLRI